jgi:hypothetical protein
VIAATGAGSLTNRGTVVSGSTGNGGPNGVEGPLLNAGALLVHNSLAGTGPITNAGTVAIDADQALSTSAYTQTAGTTTLHGGAATLAATAGGVTVQRGVLAGIGTIGGRLVNGGELAPGLPVGRLQITGDYVATAGAKLAVDIGGPGPGTGFDQVVVAGAATLLGSLAVAGPAQQRGRFAVLQSEGALTGRLGAVTAATGRYYAVTGAHALTVTDAAPTPPVTLGGVTVRGATVRARVRCGAGATGCSGALALSARQCLKGARVLRIAATCPAGKGRRARTVRLGRATFRIAARRSRLVAVRLTPAGRRLVARVGRARATLEATVTAGGRTTTVASRAVTLRA